MSHIATLIFTGFIVGDVLVFRETSDLFIGLVLILYAFVCKLMKDPGVIAIGVSIGSLIFMYISFLRYQHGPMTERFAVWTVIFFLVSLVTQCYELIKHRKSIFHKRL